MNCKACGTPLASDAQTCGNCGYAVLREPTTPSASGQSAPTAPATIASAAPSFDRPPSTSTSTASPILSSSSHSNTPATGSSPTAMPAKPGRSLGIVLVSSFILLLLGIYIAYIYFPRAKDPQPVPSNSTGTSERAATESNGDTTCYRITLPPNAKATTDLDCALKVSFSQEQGSSLLRIDSLIGQYASLQEAIDKRKELAKKYEDTIISEEAFKAGPYAAHKLIYRYKTGSEQSTRVLYIVYTGPKYKIEGYNPDGLEIDGNYATDAERADVDRLVAGIEWK